jgi:hypothetical protein
MNVSRIKDVSLGGNCCIALCCCGRKTVYIHAADVSHPDIQLTAFRAHHIYSKLRDARTKSHTHEVMHL